MAFEVTEVTQRELEERFGVQAQVVGGEHLTELKALHGLFSNVAQQVVELAPMSRELSLCLTKLEEAKFWAIRSQLRYVHGAYGAYGEATRPGPPAVDRNPENAAAPPMHDAPPDPVEPMTGAAAPS